MISRGVSGVIFNDEDDDPANPGADCAGDDDGRGRLPPHGQRARTHADALAHAFGHRHAHATATATATATPGATRTIDLSPPGWHDLAWSGADATEPGTALACIAGKYSIAYAWEGPTAGFKRHVEGCAVPGICNMAAAGQVRQPCWSTSAPPARPA